MRTKPNSAFLLFVMVLLVSLNLIGVVTAQEGTMSAPNQTGTPEATPEPESTPIVAPEGWTLVWHDEFDGDEINLENWTYDIGGHGWGNGEAQYYTDRPENSRLEDGMLVIEARQERYENSYYTSARLKSEGLQEFQYGYIEARMRVPEGRGLWPAFWMLGSNFSEVGWPDSGEIDIMEYLGREPDLILGTIHGPGYSGALGLTRWNRQDFDIADDFHTYAIEWDENQITWFFDGEAYSTYTREDVGEREWPFDQPFFLILNLALGGTYPGPIGLDVVFPKQLLVDYVRVFQQE